MTTKMTTNIVFCLPGKSFSSNYFNSWNKTISELNRLGISYAYCMDYDPVIYYVRNRILGGSNTSGKDQKPWQDQIGYDWMVWIDSDMVWEPSDVIKLIQSDKNIVSGAYVMSDGTNLAMVEHLDFKHLATAGAFKFMTKTEISTRTEPFKVSYAGFGFMAIRKGIIESMEYPWFRPRWVSEGIFHDFCAEDVGFCWTAKEFGHEIWVDPTVRPGHEKSVILGSRQLTTSHM